MHIHLDPVGGVAGDMFAAAVLDAFPEWAAPLAAELTRAGLDDIVTVRVEPFGDEVLRGTRFHAASVSGHQHAPAQEAGDHEHDHRHEHDHSHGEHGGHGAHGHRRFADIREWLKGGRLAAPVAERAVSLYTALAEAESEVHGVPVAEVAFHEVGAWDSTADIVCAAWLIEALGGDDASWSCAPLPLGGGVVSTAHGPLPVPAPATALLLRGMPVHHDGVEGERITPTGAAIVRHLDPAFDRAGLAGHISRIGHGFGTRRLEGRSNILRVLVFDTAEAAMWQEETIGVCSFEVDDQTAEDLAAGLEQLRALDGVLDVLQTPAFGKKGRMVTSVRILVRPEARARVLERCFAETTTIGVRWEVVSRAALAREATTATVDGEPVRVKRTWRPGGRTTVKAEADDVARPGAGHAERETKRRQAERDDGNGT